MYIEIENLEDNTIEVSELIEIPADITYNELSKLMNIDAHLDNDSILEIE